MPRSELTLYFSVDFQFQSKACNSDVLFQPFPGVLVYRFQRTVSGIHEALFQGAHDRRKIQISDLAASPEHRIVLIRKPKHGSL